MAYITQRLKVIQGTVSNGALSLDMEFIYPNLSNATYEVYSVYLRNLVTLEDTPIDNNHVYTVPSVALADSDILVSKTVTNLGNYYKFNIEVRLESILQDIRYNDGQFYAVVTLVFKEWIRDALGKPQEDRQQPVWIKDLMVPIQQSEIPEVKTLYADTHEDLKIKWRLQKPRQSVLAYEYKCYSENLARGVMDRDYTSQLTEERISDYITDYTLTIQNTSPKSTGLNPNWIPPTIPNPDYKPRKIPNPAYQPEIIPNPEYTPYEPQFIYDEEKGNYIVNPNYKPKEIPNPNYNPEALKETIDNPAYKPEFIPNPDYVEEGTEPELIPNPDYDAGIPMTIPNPDYTPKEIDNPDYDAGIAETLPNPAYNNPAYDKNTPQYITSVTSSILNKPLKFVFSCNLLGVSNREVTDNTDATTSVASRTYSKDSYYYQPILSPDRVPILIKIRGKWHQVESAKVKYVIREDGRTLTGISDVVKSTTLW